MQVVHLLNLGVHAFVIARSRGHGSTMTASRTAAGPGKIRPMVFDLEGGTYSEIGNVLGKAFGIGREFVPKK